MTKPPRLDLNPSSAARWVTCTASMVDTETKEDRKRRLALERLKACYQTPEGKARLKAYQQNPGYKAYRKAYQQTPEYKALRRAYRRLPKYREYDKAYRQRTEAKVRQKVCQLTPKYKAYQKTRDQTPERKAYRKAYYGKSENRTRQNKLTKLRRDNDPVFKLTGCLRVRVRDALKSRRKSASTLELLGCSIAYARAHLEAQFKRGWTWTNHGKVWHIDHIRPLASFTVMDESEQRAAFHYTNLQPLLGSDNLSKGSLYNGVRHRKPKA